MSKKVALYIRVSTQEQAQEGYSIPAQKERLLNYCKAKDWIPHDVYVDGGYSGANLNRPGMQKLIQDMPNIDMVLVYKLDRLSRSQKDTLYLIEDVFLKNNVDFVSINESFDTSTPFGRAMIGILSVFAQLERETIKERSLMGRLERAKEGLFHGGGTYPIGYDYVDGKLVVNEYEAMQVKEVYELYLKGYGIRSISDYMIQKGYTHKYGGWKNESAVISTLESCVYAGKIQFKDILVNGQHNSIITEDVFNKVQQLRKRKKELFPKAGNTTALLTGILWCGECKARFAHNIAHKKYGYYTCYSRAHKSKRLIKDPNCSSITWKEKELDKIIKSEIFKASTNPDYLNKKDKSKPSKNNNSVITKKINEIDKQIKKLMDLYQFNNFPITEISSRIQNLSQEKSNLEKQLNKIPVTDINKPIYPIIKNLKDVWDTMDHIEKRNTIKTVINKIILYKDKTIEIEWNV